MTAPERTCRRHRSRNHPLVRDELCRWCAAVSGRALRAESRLHSAERNQRQAVRSRNEHRPRVGRVTTLAQIPGAQREFSKRDMLAGSLRHVTKRHAQSSTSRSPNDRDTRRRRPRGVLKARQRRPQNLATRTGCRKLIFQRFGQGRGCRDRRRACRRRGTSSTCPSCHRRWRSRKVGTSPAKAVV